MHVQKNSWDIYLNSDTDIYDNRTEQNFYFRHS